MTFLKYINIIMFPLNVYFAFQGHPLNAFAAGYYFIPFLTDVEWLLT